MDFAIAAATDDAAIARCWPVLAELRPRFTDAAMLVAQVSRQFAGGYHLVYRAEDEGRGRVVACAGYRINEHLVWERALYVDDLVTLESERSAGHGDALIDWLEAEARRQGCKALHLDSGTQRHAAHRFYFRKRMHVSSYHFSLDLS